MQALRQRAACAARRVRPTTSVKNPRTVRTYVSESHDHHHHEAPKVEEKLGTAFYVFAGAVPAAILGYSISRPGANGEPSSLANFMRGFDYFAEDEARNTIRTQMLEQAAHDKHLFNYAGQNSAYIDLKTPELIGQGSPWAVPAGHVPNLDHVTEHYRKQFHAEEERKMKKLAAKA
ncbi:uncharacterized protein BCR38DRAFT_317382, partial [Pseudomassariella vexata]